MVTITLSARQVPHRRVVQIFSAAIAALAVVLVGVAIATALQPATANPEAADVVDAFLPASQTNNVDMATRLFESDSSITDSTGRTSRGMDAAKRLIERYDGFEPGPRRVLGSEVLWTEALPIRTPDNLQFQQQTRPELSAEVPYYAAIQTLCAEIANGKIHAVIAFPADRTFAPDGHCDGTSF